MVSRMLFYLILDPLSRMPLPVLHAISSGISWLIFRFLGYRRKVVEQNLSRSFPSKTPAEIKAIARTFYRHFCDVMVESVRLFRMSPQELQERCPVTNPELLEELYQEGRSIIIVAGHYGNWEMAALSFSMQSSYAVSGIYKPLKNTFFNQKIQSSRSRFGMELVPKKQTKAYFEKNQDRLIAPLFGGDQSPTSDRKTYWMKFLNQDTAVQFGTEKFARTYNMPVVFGQVNRLGRGCYSMTFHLLTKEPQSEPHGAISEAYMHLLEQIVQEEPAYWLWSHKRWKRKRLDQEIKEKEQS